MGPSRKNVPLTFALLVRGEALPLERKWIGMKYVLYGLNGGWLCCPGPRQPSCRQADNSNASKPAGAVWLRDRMSSMGQLSNVGAAI